ncbi:MAG: glycosyltransferase family 4 protein [Ardenticatenaceae bacterium]|nr:glycosyltransferase family 4 protein [Ardenticatenaceae bacterium]
MKILHLVHQYLPEFIGGTELYTQTLARYQVAAGHSVAVFYPSQAKGDMWQKEEEGIRVYGAAAGPRSRTRVFLSTFGDKNLHEMFTAVLQREQPDLIHIQHLMGLPTSLIEAIQVPFVITLHDYWYGCGNAQLITNYDNTICAGPDRWFVNCGRCALARAGQPQWLALLMAPLMAGRNGRLRTILHRAYKVIAPSHFVQQIYTELGLAGDNLVVIPHGIEVPQAQIEGILAKRPPHQPGTLHIGFIGSLGWQKGVHNLIAAVNELPQEGVRLTVYGRLDTFPDYVKQLQAQARHPGIHFAGPVSRDDLWAALAEFDVVVMPTLWYEASPLTIQEAFAVKVPIVASRIGAMVEKIQDGVDGRLVPPNDISALHKTLLELLENPSPLAQLRQNIHPVRTMTEQVQEIEALYQTL